MTVRNTSIVVLLLLGLGSIACVVLLLLGVGSIGYSRITSQQAAEQGNANYRADQLDQAISNRQAPEPVPQSATLYSSRCRACYQEGKFDQAIADCSRAIELDPKAADAYLHRGLALKDKGQKPQAVRDLETFLQLSDNPMDRAQVERLVNQIK